MCTVRPSFRECSIYTTLNHFNLQYSKTGLIMQCGLDQIPLLVSIKQTVNSSDATFCCSPAGHEVCVCPCEEQINRRGVRCLVTAHFVCTVIKHILVPLCLPPTLLQHSDTRELSRCFCSSYHPVLSIMSVHVCFQHDRHDMSQ